MSGSYQEDYRALQTTLDRLKARGQSMALAGPGPLSIREASTGFAVATRQGEDRMSVETALKQKRYAQMLRDGEQVPYALLLDDMVAGLDNSYLGIVHIDGNGMGDAIARRLSHMHTYAEAVAAMRALSLRISDVFTQDAFAQMIGMLPGLQEPGQKLPLRPIILAGDDITFVCRADLALPLTSAFLRCISQSALCDRPADASGESAASAQVVPDLAQYGFSACAGIAYAHSHHPFSKAYLLAEELCQSAKAKTKAPQNLVDGRVGSYVDYHICYGGVLDELEDMRGTQYTNQQGLPLLRRPICVDESAPQDIYTLARFTADLAHLASMPRGWMKRARNACHMTEGAIGRVFSGAEPAGAVGGPGPGAAVRIRPGHLL